VSITNIQLDEGIITCNLAIGEAVEAPDSLYYDDGNPRAFYPNENNWSKVTFTNQHEFELGTISFMPFNPGPNPDASCFIRVYSEDDDHNLEELLWETEIEELEPWNWDDYDENWHRIIIPEDERIQFENRQNFTIVYGPAPGGEYDPDNIEEGDGWWHMIDADVEAVRSFYYSGDDPHEDHAEWHETSGDLFIRAIAGGQVEEEQPEIEVDPIEIEFVLRSDEEEARNIVIRNIGESRLEFDTELNYICDEDNWISWAPHDAEVEVNEEIVIEVTASASDLEAGEYEAELHILSNDPENDNVTVSITMIIEEGYPHIEVTWSEEYGYPDIMDWNEAFNDLQINRNYGIEFTVTNSGNALLVVDEIYIQGADTYNVADDAFEVQPDEQRDVGITFRSDRSGEFEAICYIASNDPDVWEFQIPLHAIIDNHAPEVSREINNRELEEDFESFVIVDLNNVFDDADDDDLEFVAQSNNENLVVEIEDGSRLRLVAAENWFGEATITITADDGVEEDRDLGPVRELRSARSQANSLSVNQFGISSSTPGRDETAETSFDVVVISVNDAPEFVDNPDDVEVQETDLIEFTLTAEDVDLELDEDETLTLTILDDDGVLDRGANFVDNRDGTGDFSWQTDYDDAGEYIPIFRVRDRAGATRAVAVWIVVLNTNRAPEWIQALEPVEFDEDDAERIVVDLDECVSDPDDDVLRFSYEVDEGFNARITNENEFYIQPVENWNGDTEIVITADDGNDGLVSEVLILSVNSINDLPSEFSLISPADNAVVNTSPDVEFTWQASIDVVEDSSVSYNLVLNFNDEDHWYRNLEETALSVSREDLSLDPNLATEIVWWVWADDGMDSLESSEHFQLTVASLSVSDVAGLMPDKLSLGPVSPNPFNSSATIRYQLPEQAHIRLSIYDMNGRQIAELTNGEVEAGYHSAVWNGSTYPAGIYICRMEAGKTSLTRKLVLVR
ncbi:MAG: T9SS type A sorting domain-containing protein, partial [Calditrichaeota bacterium]|nr:T9SS type A sorting domain-containing protein [Calditrichota bacterium]